ncbi:Nitric oxide reductase NADH:FprA oxidoreductase [Aedoeadaptatus ivorii]|uniref:Rubredoxin n=1 Tax=Aedoeadaptatus ivorii TaxID=54006 RepID=A0A3S4YVS2_9FIRM|nr:rubredoxin [Peptoniphilus ivorii]VEJ35922.1 Nitric oxide reductase NADH:FprA oxidoreductase [Peptoniphilus ivorii]
MEKDMSRYQCKPCGYIYDPKKGVPEYGIEPGVPFAELPDDWTCPKCGTSKWMFVKMED